MPTYNLSVDISQLVQGLAVAQLEIAQRIAVTVDATANTVMEEWGEAVYRATGKGGIREAERDAYRASIKKRPINDHEIEIYSDYKHAAEIETGRPARDLKRMLDTSTKVRISAKGARYLIIPFRHGTPSATTMQAMPKEVYAQAKGMGKSLIVGHSWRESGLKASALRTSSALMTRSRITAWGSRLGAGAAPKLAEHHKTDQYAGMVRMNVGSGRKNNSSVYLTFRVMSERSQGWIVPAQPGLFIVQKIVNENQPLFERAIEEAVKISLPLD